MTAQIVSIVNMKGGVGKTTLTVALSEGLAVMARKRVLVVDLDAQASGTLALAGRTRFREIIELERHVYRLFDGLARRLARGPEVFDSEPLYHFGDPPPAHARPRGRRERHARDLVLERASLLEPAPTVDLIGAVPELQGLERDLLYRLGRLTQEQREAEAVVADFFRDRLAELAGAYDVILIDCPPGISLFTEAAIRASDRIIAPVIPDYLSLLGLQAFARRVLRKLTARGLATPPALAIMNRVRASDLHDQYRLDIRDQVRRFDDVMTLFPLEIEEAADWAAAMDVDRPNARVIREKYGAAIPTLEAFVAQTLALTERAAA